jgi:hypothetical protein
MDIDDDVRRDLIAAGWRPPLTDDDYEAWRPALLAFRSAWGWGATKARTPLDSVDREHIDHLREAFALAPKNA